VAVELAGGDEDVPNDLVVAVGQNDVVLLDELETLSLSTYILDDLVHGGVDLLALEGDDLADQVLPEPVLVTVVHLGHLLQHEADHVLVALVQKNVHRAEIVLQLPQTLRQLLLQVLLALVRLLSV